MFLVVCTCYTEGDTHYVKGDDNVAKSCQSIKSFFSSSGGSDDGCHGNGSRPVTRQRKSYSEQCVDTVTD